MKDYYAILRVPKSASEGEIKRSYRRLAVQYHPDKNPNPGAEELFQEINEAYEVLGDADKKRGYDYLFFTMAEPVETPPVQPHRDPAYRRPRTHTVKRKSESQQIYEFMERSLSVIHKIQVVCMGFCFFLMIDVLLPFRATTDTIKNISYRSERRIHTTHIIRLEHGDYFKIDKDDGDFFAKGDTVSLFKTRILNIRFKALSRDEVSVRLPVSIYGNFIFAPLLLLILSACGLFLFKDVEKKFNAGVGNFLVLILSIVFLFMS